MSTAISKSDQIRKLLATGMDAAAIAKQVGCSRNLVYVVKSSRKTGARRGGRGRGPGRPAKKNVGMNGLGGILAVVQNAERERVQLRAALERIQSVIAGVLA